MSDKKHVHVLNELSVHPIARNIEWSELIPALSTIGIMQVEKNGSYHFTRNGHTIVFERSHQKVVDVDEVLKLRHFLRLSALPETSNLDLVKDMIVAIDHHQAIMYHNPGNTSERRVKLDANVTNDRILHTHPTSPPFKDSHPAVDDDYYDAVIQEIAKSERVVILSHGTGTSSAASQLLAILHKKHPELADRIAAVRGCDLEAMTEPQLIQLGSEVLHGTTAAS